MCRGITYVLVFLLLGFSAKAIEKRYVFKKLNNENGLTYNTVHDIAQEESGIIWFATKQGLNKYDSYNIRRYYQEDNVGIPSNFFNSILITKNNRLFAGTDRGLIEYNRRFDRFEPLLFEGNNLPGIRTLFETSDGVVLIGTFRGIFAYHPKQNEIIKFISLQNENITSIAESDTKTLYVSTNSGIYVLNTDGVLQEYFNTGNTPELLTNIINKIYIDKAGNYWIGTENRGLYRYDKLQDKFSKVRLAESDQDETTVVRDIEEDSEGNIWICSEIGIFILDPSTFESVNIQHSLESSEYSLNDNATYCVFRSKEDMIWIGTYFGGINYTNLSNFKGFFNIYPGDGDNELRGKAVNKLYKDSNGILWIATEDGGVCTFNTETKEILNYYQHRGSEGLSSNNIHAICEDRNGDIWFGHFMTGIDIFNPKTKRFKNISILPDVRYSITENSVYSIYKDSKNDIWVGTRQGVYKYNYQTEQLMPVKNAELGQLFIYNILEDSSENIWFCIRHGGIACLKKEDESISFYRQNEFLSTNKTIAVNEDSSGKIWFGTVDGGVNVYNPETDSFNHLSMDDGLPNNTVYGILEDANRHMWLSTNQGLSMYNTETNSFRNYNRNDGLAQMQFNFGSYFKDFDGTLYFGHVNGLTYFHPAEIVDNKVKPELVFTDFKLANESVRVSEKGILSETIDQTSKITLSYSQKAFSINFVAVNHISAGNNKFYYYLEGFEADWNEIGNKTSVNYTNLLPGQYTFHLKAENNDGVESANTKSLVIRIRPPFYLSTGAFIFYLLLLVGILLLYRKITIDKQKEKAALDMERMEKEKIKELNQQRLNFYTYISHEFKTPLSIIISSIDQIFGQKDVSDDLKVRFQRLSRSSKRLSFLFNQLMDFRRIETKHAKLILQKGDIINFLRESCLVFTPLFDEHRVNFEFKANRESYEYWFDPDKIEKIIVNLISNALKHTPVHGKIICETRIIDDVIHADQRSLNIYISDTGKGISEEEQGNLFTPFYMNYQHNEQRSGSGIGLTLVKSLVEYLHGTIKVSSRPNEGTRFSIQLPLDYKGISNIKLENNTETINRILDLESIAEVSSKQQPAKEKTENDKEFKLLIVEDTVDLAEVLMEHYAQKFDVKFAKNGIEALKIVKDEEPDIIISDVMMPEMDGIEFCKKIKSDETTSHIAVILLTARTTHEDKIAGLQAGAEAYIRKPFDLNELDLHVRNFIEIRKKLKEKVVTGAHIDLEKLNFQDKDKDFIEKVSTIINENIESETLNTEELAKQLGMSKTLVYLKLKKLLNMSGSDYIQSLRFKKAIELMADSNRNISGIAYEVGFTDPNYFSKVFKKVYKKTPTVYRKELLDKIKGLNMN
ncbi:hybrid sensor histidine kinase/response regulator transcription factor [Draconibacterium mangrovi]|uniref:hybrid sensor histidine kinase/response regulator transcription factor n=1 Tax=Draconibacterium mangrovi TaxID=2697469 RepID=UPI0013D1DC5D|nr:two-component regulator propeller domain-containing protein [Draconibacterium mangrovi]